MFCLIFEINLIFICHNLWKTSGRCLACDSFFSFYFLPFLLLYAKGNISTLSTASHFFHRFRSSNIFVQFSSVQFHHRTSHFNKHTALLRRLNEKWRQHFVTGCSAWLVSLSAPKVRKYYYMVETMKHAMVP